VRPEHSSVQQKALLHYPPGAVQALDQGLCISALQLVNAACVFLGCAQAVFAQMVPQLTLVKKHLCAALAT